MISASSLAFPGSRTLASWRRLLAPHVPEALWVGYLFVHRVEALAEWCEPHPLDPLVALVLQAVTLETSLSPPASLDDLLARLDRRLHLGPAALRSVLENLSRLRLVELDSTSHVRITPEAQQALREGRLLAPTRGRRPFSFVERLDPAGARLAPPHFLALQAAKGAPWHAQEPFEFDWLRAPTTAAPEWKTSFGYPAEIRTIVSPPAAAQDADAWQRVIVDATERTLVALLVARGRWLGFAGRPEGWALDAAQPILDLPQEARLSFPDLAADPPNEAWRQAWLEWCQPRGLSLTDAAACRLSFAGEVVRIEAPGSLVQRLQASKSDIFKGDAWLLAGAGFLRRAARMELVKGA